MKTIGVLSDTHCFLDYRVVNFFSGCDEIWHCGDFGNIDVSNKLKSKFATVRGVYGNCDGTEIRCEYKKYEIFTVEKVKVLMTHIGGYPGRYDADVFKILQAAKNDSSPFKLFVCGHSHITKVMMDKQFGCLHINPGAAGKYGFHKFQTAVKFTIDGNEIKDLYVWEKELRCE